MNKVGVMDAIMEHFGVEYGDIFMDDDGTFQLNDDEQRYRYIELPGETQDEFQYAFHKVD